MERYAHAELADGAAALDSLGLTERLTEASCKPVQSGERPCQDQTAVGVGSLAEAADRIAVFVKQNGEFPDLEDSPLVRVDDGT